MQIVGVVLMALVGWLLYRWAKDPAYDNFRIIYCISSKEGFPDGAKMREWGAFFISSYGFLWLLWGTGMTEYYFIGYMGAWCLAAGYALKKRAEQNAPQSRTGTTIPGERKEGE